MIVLDANVLLYAYHPADARHDAARAWLERVLSSDELVRLPWSTIVAFVRVATHPRVFERPLTLREAADHVESWLDVPSVDVLGPGEQYDTILRRVPIEGQATGALAADAALAALTIEHGATLATTDRDFARFEGLQVLNPLE